jgi:hypothetical protein
MYMSSGSYWGGYYVTMYTVIRFVSISAKFSIGTPVGLNRTFVEVEIRMHLGHLKVHISNLALIEKKWITVYE